jgi:hypothetical protein
MTRRIRRPHKIGLVSLLLIIAVAIAQQQGWIGPATKTVTRGVLTSQPGLYAVDHFVDGDTIAVDMNGTVETIRFIGIDTPETHKPNAPVQCYGPAAAAYTKNKIGSQRVRLVSDSLSTNRDRYNRLRMCRFHLPNPMILPLRRRTPVRTAKACGATANHTSRVTAAGKATISRLNPSIFDECAAAVGTPLWGAHLQGSAHAYKNTGVQST